MRELVSILDAECCAESAESADAKTSDAKAPDTETAA
jgi:hypothetical protein